MDRIIGRCSKCGGRVVEPGNWLGIYPPIPSCAECGAKAVNDLPKIETTSPRRPDYRSSEARAAIDKLYNESREREVPANRVLLRSK